MREKGVKILRVDGTEEFIPLAKRPTLQQMQNWVGGYIQIVKGLIDGKTYTMVIDEEGKLKGKDFNLFATLYFARKNPAYWGHKIVGDAVVLIGYR